MSKCLKVVLLVVCISVLSLSFVYGKGMAKKTGVGFYQLSPVPGAVSVRHWVSDKTALNFVLGLNFFEVADENYHDVVMGMKILSVVKAEKQLNAFIGGGLDLEFAGNGDSTTAYRMKFLAGVEYSFLIMSIGASLVSFLLGFSLASSRASSTALLALAKLFVE